MVVPQSMPANTSLSTPYPHTVPDSGCTHDPRSGCDTFSPPPRAREGAWTPTTHSESSLAERAGPTSPCPPALRKPGPLSKPVRGHILPYSLFKISTPCGSRWPSPWRGESLPKIYVRASFVTFREESRWKKKKRVLFIRMFDIQRRNIIVSPVKYWGSIEKYFQSTRLKSSVFVNHRQHSQAWGVGAPSVPPRLPHSCRMLWVWPSQSWSRRQLLGHSPSY